jgi:hypothetical protein
MVKRIASVRVVSFALLAAGTALCQMSRESLPDAPSAQLQPQQQNLSAIVEKAPAPLNPGDMAANVQMIRRSEFALISYAAPSEKHTDTIFRKYLSPSYLRPLNSQSQVSASLMGRASHAASGIIVSRDESGKTRLNTSYLLRALTSVAADTASRPYWRRSVGEPFSDFGSTVGSDAGMKVWHEFSPGFQQLMKSHAPKFVSRIEQRIGHN